MNFLNFWRRKEVNHHTHEVPFDHILEKVTTAIKNFKDNRASDKPTLRLKILTNQASVAQKLAEKLIANSGEATYGKTEGGYYTIECNYPNIDLRELSIVECLNQVDKMVIEHQSILQDCELV